MERLHTLRRLRADITLLPKSACKGLGYKLKTGKPGYEWILIVYRFIYSFFIIYEGVINEKMF